MIPELSVQLFRIHCKPVAADMFSYFELLYYRSDFSVKRLSVNIPNFYLQSIASLCIILHMNLHIKVTIFGVWCSGFDSEGHRCEFGDGGIIAGLLGLDIGAEV